MSYKIPLFELNFDEREIEAVVKTIRSQWISQGPITAELEEKFSSMLGCKYSVALTNCTTALHLALKIAGIGKGDKVIVPSLTFSATVNAVRYVDAEPVFADIKGNEDLNISIEEIKKAYTPEVKAIVVMHFGGFPCDMDEIMAFAEEKNLKVIEDSCHGPLSEYKGKKLGTIGDVGCFSFFSNKNISTGEGGILVTNNEEYYKKAKLLRSHGMTSMSYERAKGHATEYDVVELGYNYRIDDIRSSIALVQLDKLQADLEKRAKVRAKYIELLSGSNKLEIPFAENKEFVSNYIFPVVLKNCTKEKRDEVRNLLAEEGVQTSVHYPSVHKFSIYNEFTKTLPHTEYASDCGVTLPMFSSLNDEKIEYISKSLLTILNNE